MANFVSPSLDLLLYIINAIPLRSQESRRWELGNFLGKTAVVAIASHISSRILDLSYASSVSELYSEIWQVCVRVS
jgi:hypothetical protein